MASQKIRQKWPKWSPRKPEDFFSSNIEYIKLKNVWEGKEKEKGGERKEDERREDDISKEISKKCKNNCFPITRG